MIVGLGNPGTQYAATRHNIGFAVVDALAAEYGLRLARHLRAQARVGEGHLGIAGPKVILAEPTSFMNASGGPVKALLSYFDVPADRLLVVHDELDLPFESVRVKLGGGDNGHNGLKSIRSALATGEFWRVRVGIGRPPGRQDPADWVLRPFSSDERTRVDSLVQDCADAVVCLVTQGLEATQNRFHSRGQADQR